MRVPVPAGCIFLFVWLLVAGCSGKKTRLDCIRVCRDHGLDYVEVVSATKGVDPVTREPRVVDACRCK